MSIGTSGRIVLEIDPEIKRMLYSNLAARGMTLKEWFLDQAAFFISSNGKSSVTEVQSVDSIKTEK